jgi:hypothetical protein
VRKYPSKPLMIRIILRRAENESHSRGLCGGEGGNHNLFGDSLLRQALTRASSVPEGTV